MKADEHIMDIDTVFRNELCIGLTGTFLWPDGSLDSLRHVRSKCAFIVAVPDDS